MFGPMCTSCYDKGRSGNWFSILLLTVMGVVFVAGGAAMLIKGQGELGIVLTVLSLPFLGMAAYLIYTIFRRFPG
jgi:hypothetical protein